MKRILLNVTLGIIAFQTIPACAMLARMTSALRPNILAAEQYFAQPTTESFMHQSSMHQGVRQKIIFNTNTGDSSSGNNQQSWWQRFSARFSQNKTAPALGFSLFGYHLWWSKDEICQTAKDFEDPGKLALTKECFAKGNKTLVFDTFIEKFNTFKEHPEALERMLEFFCATFDDVKSNPPSFKALKRLVIDNFDTFEKHTLGIELIQKIARDDLIFNEILDTIELFAQSKSQSAHHFSAASQDDYPLRTRQAMLLDSFYTTCLRAHGGKNIIQQVLELEKIEQEKGNYTFVHAYNWGVHFYQDLDTHLRAAIYGTPTDSLSLRFIKPPHVAKHDAPITKRKKLMTEGAQSYYIYEGIQKNMIFMNCAIATYTLDLILRNQCVNQPNLMLQKIFDHLHLANFLHIYEKEIKELQILHNKANSFGAGILFSFTPEMLEQSVYVCKTGGIKCMVKIKGIGETNDVKLILDTVRTKPESIKYLSALEFVFVVTKDCGLNPNIVKAGGMKAIPFNATDPAAYALYEQKRDVLIAKIKAAVKAKEAKLSKKQKLNRALAMKQIDAWFTKYNCLSCNESRIEE